MLATSKTDIRLTIKKNLNCLLRCCWKHWSTARHKDVRNLFKNPLNSSTFSPSLWCVAVLPSHKIIVQQTGFFFYIFWTCFSIFQALCLVCYVFKCFIQKLRLQQVCWWEVTWLRRIILNQLPVGVIPLVFSLKDDVGHCYHYYHSHHCPQHCRPVGFFSFSGIWIQTCKKKKKKKT